MKEARCIAVFYSQGPHFTATLRTVRARWPEARIIALVPKGFPVDGEQEQLATKVQELARAHYALRDTAAIRELLGAIRAHGFDTFVIMFDTLKLRGLAKLSRAGQTLHTTPDNRLTLLSPSLTGAVLRLLALKLYGRYTYLRLWLIVRLYKTH